MWVLNLLSNSTSIPRSDSQSAFVDNRRFANAPILAIPITNFRDGPAEMLILEFLSILIQGFFETNRSNLSMNPLRSTVRGGGGVISSASRRRLTMMFCHLSVAS